MPPEKHAKLSASSAHRWLNCNPSAQLEREFADRSSEAAAEGSAAHALCEHKLRKALKMRSTRPPSKYDSDEMELYTDSYVEFVQEQIEVAKQHCSDPFVLIEQKLDFNAQFERICLSKYLGGPVGTYIDPVSWRCTMVWAATLGLPLSLEGVGAVLGLEKQKLKEGKDLIRYFCTPAKAKDGSAFRHYPSDAPEKWETFKAYNLRDVETEMAIQDKLAKFPVDDAEWKNYCLDQRINDRGIMLDMTMVHQVLSLRDLTTKATATMSDMPGGGSRNVYKMQDIIGKIIDLENEINADIDQLVDLKREMVALIKSVENPEYQTLLELRYLCFKTWEQIAVIMQYSTRNIYKLHETALTMIHVPN